MGQKKLEMRLRRALIKWITFRLNLMERSELLEIAKDLKLGFSEQLEPDESGEHGTAMRRPAANASISRR